ncbi:MAG: phosphatidate cytidylyltransferase [Lachnospiraceae bacterium]|nr:phosphatidate cytidylyltransferase [Lachnospiraceae bacterium]
MASKISKERVISGIILVMIALATILPGGAILAVTLYLISNVAFLELTKACGIRTDEKLNALEVTGLLAIASYYLLISFAQTYTYFMITVILVLMALMFVYVFSFPKFKANQVMATYFSLIYAPVMLSFIFLTRQLPYGIYLVWMIFISSWISDTCAYLVGVLIGKHKLVPQLSPKKTVEGSIGGILGSAVVGALFGFLLLDKTLGGHQFGVMLFVIGAIGSVISQVGDLAASAIKRNHDIKDYGKLIPGHGGIMDRFDSVIFTAPMIYFLIIIFLQ